MYVLTEITRGSNNSLLLKGLRELAMSYTALSIPGEVGDWKNYFTVAESEHFDMLLQEKLKDNMLWSFYTKVE